METALIPKGLEPLGAWIPSAREWWDQHRQERIAWAKAHMLRPGDTVRIDFFLFDAPFAVAYRIRRNEDGRPYTDPDTGDIAMEPPAMQVLDELPPAHLLGGT